MTWLTMVLIGLGSYGFRVLPLLVLPHFELSERADRTLRHAGTAALTALVVNSVAGRGGTGELTALLLALAVGAALAVRGAPMLRVVAAGAVTYAAVVAMCTVIA